MPISGLDHTYPLLPRPASRVAIEPPERRSVFDADEGANAQTSAAGSSTESPRDNQPSLPAPTSPVSSQGAIEVYNDPVLDRASLDRTSLDRTNLAAAPGSDPSTRQSAFLQATSEQNNYRAQRAVDSFLANSPSPDQLLGIELAGIDVRV